MYKKDVKYQIKRFAVNQGLAASVDEVPGNDVEEVWDFINTKLEEQAAEATKLATSTDEEID